MKRNKKLGALMISLISVLSVVLVLSFIIVKNTKNSSSPEFDKTTTSYISSESEIISEGEGREEADSYLRLNTLYTISGSTVSRNSTSYDGNTVISISTPEELYAFSYLCYTNQAFLSYDYALLNNIDYTNYGVSHYFYPVGCLGTAFSGTFNGNGYDITELTLAPLTDSNTASGGQFASYSNITYFAMFGQVGTSGVIENLGLINTNININAPSLANLEFISPLVGVNNGTIRYTYAQDLRDASTEEGGITAAGAYQVSGLVSLNKGVMQNSYTAYSIIVNYTLSMTVVFWHEILIQNDGTISNLYYFNNSIPTETGYSETSDGKEKIIYDATLIGRTQTREGFGATYVETLQELNEKVVESSNEWYSNTSYGQDLTKPLENVLTPILRGLEYDASTKTFTITDEYDYIYMYELFNISSYFASSAITYKFVNDIDLKYIPTENYVYESNIGCNFVGTSSDRKSILKANGEYSEYPTIFNATVFNTIVNEGMNCYGVFPWFTGSIDGLNFFFDDTISIAPASLSSNVNAIGLLSGYAEGASINNVNTYGVITLGSYIGRVYAGGAIGVLGGNASVVNLTTSGSITGTSSQIFTPESISGYMNGIAIAGAIGYMNDSYPSIDTILASVTITAPTYSSSNNIEAAIGGVIGAGYTNKAVSLQNKGNITINGNYYKALYTAGVIGRLLGVKQQITGFHNQGDISATAANTNLYIAGVVNADIQTTASDLSVSLYKNSASKYIFYASSFSNGGLLSVGSKSTSTMYSGVANIFAANNFLSTISGFYNLTYKYADDTSSKIYDKAATSINMYYVPTFGAVISTNATSSNGLITASTIYNFRSYSFTTTQSTSIAYSYSGCVNGLYVTGDELRNEGNMTFAIKNSLNSGSELKVTGIVTEVSKGCKIESVYNGGNISIDYTATVTGNIYASGICYANRNGFSSSEINKFDPSSESYDDDATGSINYCINNGAIEVTNSNYSSIAMTGYVDVKSANGSVTTERHYYAGSTPSANLVGNICVSGITNYNYSVITNTFNIADMFAANYITSKTRNEINASGLVTYNIGRYAVIENSANDGTIKAINLSFYFVFNNGQTNHSTVTAQYAFVNASGIVCHNNINEDGSIYSNGNNHSKQIIAFTINYGSVYSYNVARNSTSSAADNFRTISAGILGEGLLNLVNVVNYGNIYGSEVSGGVVGVMFFNSFNTEVKEGNEVTFANTINYANVLVIDKGELNYRDSSYYCQSYSSFRALDSSSTCYYTSIDVYSKDYFNGSVFGIINFAGSSNANYVTIRYLISFNEDVTLVGAEAQTPSTVTVDLSTFYSAYIDFDGSYTLDTYIGKPIVYAPLSTGSEKINGVTYYGVFNNNFSFRQAVNGNEDYLDIAHYPTDQFVSDYFEFVGATYINQSLLNTIGWGDIAYSAAADSFATDISGVAKYITYLSSNSTSTYNSLITTALSTDTWISKCGTDELLQIVQTLIDNESSSELLTMLEYIFSSESTSYSLITSEARSAILEKLIENDASIDYSSIIESIITYSSDYSSSLADSILNNDDAGSYIYEYLEQLDDDSLENILTTYCEYLKNQSANSYFTYSNSEQIRYDILTAMFENISDAGFYTYLAEVLGIDLSSVSVSNELSMYTGLSSLSDSELIAAYKAIVLNNSYANIKTYVNSMSSEINYYIDMINRGYLKTSLDNIYSDAQTSSSSTATTTVDERIALWNQIRTTEVFKNYLNTKITSEYIAKATEVNNTYQTTTYPYESATSSAGDLSFTYTFDITPNTYFLGPYKDVYKNQYYFSTMTSDVAPTCGDSNYTQRSIIDVTTKAQADYLYNNGYTYSYQLFYYEYSDSSSNNQLCAVRRNLSSGIENKYAFTWFKTSKTTDFTGGFLHGTYTDVNDSWVQGETWVDGEIWVTDTSGVTFDANGGGISKFTSSTSGSTGEGGYANNLNRTGTWVITDANQKQHTVSGTLTQWADFIIAHEIRHYISYPTSSIHSTLNTGLSKYRSGNRWFVWNGNAVLTSQYIDYSVDQLLELDGYLTAYADGTTVSSDERDIINTLFNTYFVTDSTNFNNMVAAALLEKNAQVDNDSYYYVGTPEFNATTKIYYTLTAAVATSYNESTTYYKKSGNDYIVASGVNSTNYSSYYTVVATRVNDYYNYTNLYVMKDVDDYDADYIRNLISENIYSSTLVSSKSPLEYLYIPQYVDSGSLITVKEYLMSLSENVTSKEDFIGYCAGNQNAYAKLLLALMNMNETYTPVTITFPVNIGDSETSDVTVENLGLYDQLSVVNNSVTIDSNTYQYGYQFYYLRIYVDSDYTNLYLVVNSTTSTRLYYAYPGDEYASGYFTINGGTTVSIDINGNSYIDVLLYSTDYVGYVTLYNAYQVKLAEKTQTFTYNILNAGTNQSVNYLIYQLPTADQFAQLIENNMEINGIDAYNDAYTYSVSITITSHNNDSNGNDFVRYHRFVYDATGTTSSTTGNTTIATSSAKINYNATYSYTINTLPTGRYGAYIGLVTSTNNRTYAYYTATRGNGALRVRLYSIVATITYNYETLSASDNIVTQDSIYQTAIEGSSYSMADYYSDMFNRNANYNDSLLDATYNLVPVNYYQAAYNNSLVSSTYYVLSGDTYTLATGSYDSSKSYFVRSGSGTEEDPYVYTSSSPTSTAYYATTTSTSYYVLDGEDYVYAQGSYNSSTTYYRYNGEYEEATDVLVNLVDILGLNETHNDSVTKDYCLPELVEALITSSNEAFITFIKNTIASSDVADEDYEIILKYLTENIGYYSVNDAITAGKSGLSTDSKEVVGAAYLVTDYSNVLTNETSVYDSALRTYLSSGVSSQYQYINSDGSYDNEKFEDFCNLIGYNLSTSGYGIYALSSNHGKLNGEFIPDNLVLDKMDANYAYSTEGECYVLVNEESSSWRGNNSTDGDVEYAFDVEMKQLVKSISTAIFELDLISSDDVVLYSSESSIDLENKTITYYVPKGSTYTQSLTIDTNSMVLANNATLYLNGVLVTKGSTTASFSLNVGENAGLIRVYAENTAVYDDYTIIIVEADFSFDLTEHNNIASGSYEVEYKDGTIVLNVTSPKSGDTTSDKLPAGMDLTPYISIQSLDGTVMSNAFTLNESPVVDANGKAVIDMTILVTLPTGTYNIVVDIYGNTETYTFIKNPSTECDMISFVYEGSDIVSSFTEVSSGVYSATSSVLYGRAFDYDELINYSYLTSLEYSNGATISVSASYTETDGLITYLITYVVKAEDGSTKTYNHYVTESAPYSSGSPYVSSYIDGEVDSTMTKNYSTTMSSNEVNFSFHRGDDHTYRVKYNLGGFYILGNATYSYELAKDYAEGTVSVSLLTAGLSIEINDSADAGTYTFYYKYISSGDWNGTTYYRDYDFPAVNVEKLASQDALLDSITFISSATKISTLSTVMYPSSPIRPTGDDLVTADGERSYTELSADAANNKINVTSDSIVYNGYDTDSYKNYYIVGAVSNVNLSSYAPTFGIDEYAQIYQYTTLSKIKEYGSDNNQTKTDKTILENTNRVFIYVPYVDSSNNTKIFLVEINMNNGYKWLAAYPDSWNGSDATTLSFNTTTHAITDGTTTYTVSDMAGVASSKNQSLYMNYIGNPLTDSDSSDSIDDSHFWYVSYVVFSEDALVNGTDKIKFYHVSMIDLENTNYFVFTINAPTTYQQNSIYLTLTYNVYDDNNNLFETRVLSLFANYDSVSGSYKVYIPTYSITLLPRAYYSFTLSLPDGYAANYEVTNGKKNTNSNANEEGKYLPPASLIIQEIDITITIYEVPSTESGIWGIGTSSTSQVNVTEKSQ